MPEPRPPRLTQQSLLVLKLFADHVNDSLAGTDVMKCARLSSGTLYPILLRFEQSGLLESRWEEEEPRNLGRPRRRLYTVTTKGAAVCRAALKELLGARLPYPIPKVV